MSNITKKELTDLIANPELNKRIAEFQNKINQQPPDDWLRQHPFIKNYLYLPIARVEFLLRSIFQRWEWKVVDFRIVANAIAVHGTLRVLDPITNEWLSYDGLGAVDIQLKAGSNATDFTQITANAIMKNLPAAESYALKDAAEKIGTIFGGDLNRKDEINFQSPYSRWKDENELTKLETTND